MKTTIKRILCAALTLVMILGTVPAFAAEIGDVALWADDRFIDEIYYDEYCYGGKVTEGINHLTSFCRDEYIRYYYEFDVAKNGYYLISNDAYYGEFGDDGITYYADYPRASYVETDDGLYNVVYLEEPDSIFYPEFYNFAINYWPSDSKVEPISDYMDAAKKGQQKERTVKSTLV